MRSDSPSLARCVTRPAYIAAFLGSAVASAAAGAQATVQPAADTSHLPAVVITATRVPFSEAVPTASTTVITGQTLQARGIVSVADALRDVAGAAPVETGSMGGLTSLFFRGGQSGYVKVLLDGVPLNEPGGVYYFQNLTVADVDRIEIVRGPTSVLYGSDAMTGVIQIFTKRGTGAPAGWLDLSGGSYKSYDGSAGLEGGAGAVGFSVGGTRQTTAGILPFNNQYTNGELGGRLDLGRGTSSSLALTGRYHTADYHFPTVGDGTPVEATSIAATKDPHSPSMESTRFRRRWTDISHSRPTTRTRPTSINRMGRLKRPAHSSHSIGTSFADWVRTCISTPVLVAQ